MHKEQEKFEAFVDTKITRSEKLPVTPQIQVLPLTSLDWKSFEQLCCRLVAYESDIEGTPYLYGVPGEDQKGIDIVAKKRVADNLQTWCYQCKNYQVFSSSDFKQAIEALEYDADHYIFLIASEAGTKLQDIADRNGVELWDVRIISSRLKYHPDLVADFFGLAWQNAFCIPRDVGHLAVSQIYRSPKPKQPFIGRESELDTLYQHLSKQRIIIIEGIGGVGKTEVLLQALSKINDVPTVWLDVESFEKLSDLRHTLLRAFSKEGFTPTTEQELFVYLDRQSLRIVFDGLDRIAVSEWDQVIDFLSLLIRSTEQPMFVVTTQIETSNLDFDAFRLLIGSMPLQASEDLLSFGWKQQQGVKFDKEDIEWLLQLCDGHPLSLRLVIGLIKYYKNTKVVVRRLRSAGADELRDPLRKQQKTTTSLDVCLIATYAHFNHQQKRLLQYISGFPVGCIDGDAQYFQREGDYSTDFAELRRFFFVDVREDPILPSIDRLYMLNPIRLFVQNRWKSEAEEETVEIQVSIAMQLAAQAFAFSQLSLNVEMSAVGLELVDFGLPNYQAAMRYAMNGKEWKESHNQDATSCREAILSLAYSLFSYFFVRTFLPDGVKFAQAGMDAGEELGDAHLDEVLTLYYYLFGQQRRLRDLAGLEETSTRFEKIAERIAVSTNEADKAIVALTLGDLKLDQQLYKDAIEQYKIAEAYYNSLLRTSSQKKKTEGMLSLVQSHLGRAYEDQKEYHHAIEYYTKALSHIQHLQTDFNIGAVFHQLGNCYAYINNVTKALEYYQQALQIFVQYQYSQFMSNSMNEIGNLIIDIGLPENLEALLVEEVVLLGLNDVTHDIEYFLTVVYPKLSPYRAIPSCRELHRKMFNVIVLVSFTKHLETLRAWAYTFVEETLRPLGNALYEKLSVGEKDSTDNLDVNLRFAFVYDLILLLMIAHNISTLLLEESQEEENYITFLQEISKQSHMPISKRVSKWFPTLLGHH